MDDYKKIEYDRGYEFCCLVFEYLGIPKKDSQQIADVVLTSDLMGIESHGLQRLKMYYDGSKAGRINPNAQPKIIQETMVSAVIDADEGYGQIVGGKAMKLAIQKAKEAGIGMVLVKNSSHYGIAGYYSMMAAKEGLLGISMTNSEALVLPTFGRTPVMGTNPIALTMPAKPYPFHIDMATSVVPAGKIEVYNKKQKAIPIGWVLNAEGKNTTVAQDFINIRKNKTDGGLLPLGGTGETHGGHKGYGLSMMVELMTGILSGGCTSYYVRRDTIKERCCHMFMAIDYAMFGNKEDVEKHMSAYMELVRASNKSEGETRIYTHGERELSQFNDRKMNGFYINGKTYEELEAIAAEAGLDKQKYLGA